MNKDEDALFQELFSSSSVEESIGQPRKVAKTVPDLDLDFGTGKPKGDGWKLAKAVEDEALLDALAPLDKTTYRHLPGPTVITEDAAEEVELKKIRIKAAFLKQKFNSYYKKEDHRKFTDAIAELVDQDITGPALEVAFLKLMK